MYLLQVYKLLVVLLGNFKPHLPYLGTVKRCAIGELPQSCEAICNAILSGKVFCPSKKGARHDGCFYDLKIGKVTEVIQFKLKSEGKLLSHTELLKYC